MRRGNQLLKCYLSATAALVLIVPASPARAQETLDGVAPGATADTADTADTTDIVVTARRRSETLQDVPIAVTVLTSRDIERAGIRSVNDFANLIPNVTFDNSLNLGTNFLTIRGVSQSQYGAPPAAIVIDGVLQISPLQFNVDEFDLQQIEVLKGPQGAIYGKNAIAGAVNISTLKPGPDFQSHVLASYARGKEWQGKASVSGPIVPDLLYALAGISYVNRRGQVQNITNGHYSDKLENLTGRLRLVITPADNIEADIKYTYSDAKGHDPHFITSRSGNPRISSDPFDANRIGTNPRTLHDLSGKLTLDQSFATTTLTLAYVDVKEGLDEELDYSPIDFLAAKQRQRDKGFSQELRFTSPSGEKFQWVVGGYHVRSNNFLGSRVFIDPFYLGLAPAPTSAYLEVAGSQDRYHVETWAGFGQLSYNFSSNLSIEANLRYDTETLRQTPVGGVARRVKFSKWQPKGTVTYKPTADITLYGSVGQGFRSGKFNASGAAFGEAVVRPEVATTYEVGAKSRFLDNRLTLNAAIYQTDLKNGQFNLFDAVGGTNAGINIDKTRIRGFELEGALRVIKGFNVNASFGYTDPKVLSFTPPRGYLGSTSTYIGNRPVRVAKVTANVGFDFDIPVSERVALFVRPDYRFVGPYYWDLENDYKRPAYNLVNIRAGVRDIDDRWAFTGFVKNALNEKITSDYSPFTTTGLPTGKDVYYPPVGAIYGVEITYSF